MTTYIGNLPEGAKELAAQLPIGSVVAYPSISLPLGWLECNGQNTTAYPLLAAIIGANVPDLRGEFIRGFDNGKGTDVGRALGSSQADEFRSHFHTYSTKSQLDVGGSWGTRGLNGTTTHDGNATGGAETRPRNIALIYIIKAFNVVASDGDGSIRLDQIQNPPEAPVPDWDGRVLSGAELTAVNIIGANPEARLYPDGSVVGSSDNGHFTKWPNGELSCQFNPTISVNNSTVADYVWSLPVASISNSTDIATPTNAYGNFIPASFLNFTGNNITLRFTERNGTASTTTIFPRVEFKGRWKA